MRELISIAILCAVLATACKQAAPPVPEQVDRDAPTYSVRLGSEIFTLTIDEPVLLPVSIERTADFSHAVQLSVNSQATLPPGLQIGSLTVPSDQSAGQLQVVADDRVTPGQFQVPLQAAAGGQSKQVMLSLDIRAPLARIDTVLVDQPAGEQEVRQGHGLLVLTLEGQHFNRITGVTLDDLDLTVAAGSSDTRLHLHVSVDHGASPGPRDLELATESYGSMTVPDFLVVTPVTAGPAGSDLTGQGTTASPFRTLSHSLTQAAGGDTVYLLDGTYDTAAGELWPQQTWFATEQPTLLPATNVPDGVTVIGESVAGVILRGDYPVGQSLGLSFAGTGGASRLTLTEFATAVVAANSEQILTGLLLSSNSEGILAIADANITVRDSQILSTLHQGVRVTNDSHLIASDLTVDNALWALDVHGSAQAELVRTSLTGSQMEGIRMLDSASVFLNDSEISGSQLDGILMRGLELVIRDSVLAANGGAGLRVELEPQLVDLGNLLESGGNSLHDNGGYQLHDARSDRPDLFGQAITLAGTSLQGVVPAPDVAVGPVAHDDLFIIGGVNQLIQFY